jgi:hypothetical protein
MEVKDVLSWKRSKAKKKIEIVAYALGNNLINMKAIISIVGTAIDWQC